MATGSANPGIKIYSPTTGMFLPAPPLAQGGFFICDILKDLYWRQSGIDN